MMYIFRSSSAAHEQEDLSAKFVETSEKLQIWLGTVVLMPISRRTPR
jgi:hypothetical protein